MTRGTIRTISAVTGGAAAWFAPLAAGQPELGELDLGRLHRFDTTLRELLTRFPIDTRVQPILRSERLLRIRHELAASGHLAVAVPACDGGGGCPVLVQTMLQFICGYHDIDLRDATGLGHGRLIAAYASAPVRDRWLPRLLAGTLAGIGDHRNTRRQPSTCHQHHSRPAPGRHLGGQRDENLDQPPGRGRSVLRVLQRPRRTPDGRRRQRRRRWPVPPTGHPSGLVRMGLG